ncbi:unnamed protein product [Pedinophyceae sp. YPF-701]|nr:unnamed protein product [Pedinophyceae sp. YPF-701]
MARVPLAATFLAVRARAASPGVLAVLRDGSRWSLRHDVALTPPRQRDGREYWCAGRECRSRTALAPWSITMHATSFASAARPATVLGGRPAVRAAVPAPQLTGPSRAGAAPRTTPPQPPAFSASVRSRTSARGALVVAAAELKALVWDCDGVILESEDLHRRAYNAAFAHFDVRVGGEVVEWDVAFYDKLQNTVGGGKPKMRWFFGEHKNEWPTTSILDGRAPETDGERVKIVDVLQDWKTDKYQAMLASGEVPPRAGVIRLMDAARDAGLKVAVCSAATKSSVIATLNALIGPERFEALDCFIGGDDAPKKKPDPIIYHMAAERLQLDPQECMVIEDSTIGLAAAKGANMRCMITYTDSTKSQDFDGAEIIVGSLGDDGDPKAITIDMLREKGDLRDDRGAAKPKKKRSKKKKPAASATELLAKPVRPNVPAAEEATEAAAPQRPSAEGGAAPKPKPSNSSDEYILFTEDMLSQ